MIGIYKITSPSGKIYIGQSWDLNKRFKQYNSLQCKGQKKLYNSLCKYGVENHSFEIIKNINNHTLQAELDHWEHFYWEKYKNEHIELLNLIEPKIYGHISQDVINIFKQPKSEEHKRKISIAHLGKKNSIQHCLNIGLSKKGQYPKSAKRVINVDTKEIYPSARIAAEVINIPHSTMKSMLNGYRINKTNLIYYENWNNNNCNK